MNRWIGKCAVVTGASSGIGASIALTLADAGMIVVAAARRLEKLEDLKKQFNGSGELLCFRCDVSDEKDIVALMDFAKKHCGGVDVLINNAAILPTGTITDCDGNGTSLKVIEDSFKINVTSVITASRISFHDMKKRGVEGHVIVINSIAGHKVINVGPVPAVSVYPVTKHALTVLSEIIRLEFSCTSQPIRVTSISPGAVDTQMLRSVPHLTTNIPHLKPDDIADAVRYVLSLPQSVNISELTIQATGEKM